jgi:hypothetical protein
MMRGGRNGQISGWRIPLGVGLVAGLLGFGVSPDVRGAAVFAVIVFTAMVGLPGSQRAGEEPFFGPSHFSVGWPFSQ